MSPYRNRQFYKLLKLFRARSLVTKKCFSLFSGFTAVHLLNSNFSGLMLTVAGLFMAG